ncbi:MAG: hypothetical protein KDA22_15855 [Phycisphaerales bacterium]|nr:hypothetical protein [Phycisphaerales bacterium]
MSIQKHVVGTVATSVVLATLLVNGRASGNIIRNISGPTTFSYQVNQMPDFDQRREVGDGIPGLPGAGSMYCAPTAACNALSYVQAHGYPQLMPLLDQPYSYWTQYTSGGYLLETLGLALMGNAMGTDPVDGTGGTGFENGVETYFPSNLFCVSHVYASGNYAPTAGEIAVVAMGGPSGSLVLPVVGWYDDLPGNAIARDGGHVLTLSKITVNGSAVTICFRDPWTNDSKFTQSTFASQCYATQNQSVTVNGKARTMTKVLDYGSAYLDEYIVIRPLFGLTVVPDLLKIKFLFPILFEYGGPDTLEVPTGDGLPLIDFAIAPNLAKTYYLTKPAGAAGKLWETVPGIPGSTSVATLGNPIKVTTGRDGKVYAMDGNRIIRCYDFATGTNAMYIAPFDLADIDYDDTTDTIMGLSTAAKALHRITFGAAGASGVTIPYPAMPALDQGKGSIAMDRMGKAWFCSENVNTVFGLIQLPTGAPQVEMINHPELVKPRGVNVDPLGRVTVICDGSVKTFVNGPAGWQPDPTVPFSGQFAPGGHFVEAVGRTNFNPAEHTGPAYRNVEPLAIGPDLQLCDADLDLNGAVDGADLGALLAQWGADGTADLNDDDIVDGADLGLLLSEWGLCP